MGPTTQNQFPRLVLHKMVFGFTLERKLWIFSRSETYSNVSPICHLNERDTRGLHIKISNKIYMKALLITDERTRALFRDSKKAIWYVHVVKDEYRSPLWEINIDNVLVILKCDVPATWGHKDIVICPELCVLLFIKFVMYEYYSWFCSNKKWNILNGRWA